MIARSVISVQTKRRLASTMITRSVNSPLKASERRHIRSGLLEWKNFVDDGINEELFKRTVTPLATLARDGRFQRGHT